MRTLPHSTKPITHPYKLLSEITKTANYQEAPLPCDIETLALVRSGEGGQLVGGPRA